MKQLVKLVSAVFAAALVAACGGGNVFSSTAIPGTLRPATHGSKTFDYTGTAQTFKVPSGVTKLTIIAYGASGGGGGHGLPRGGVGATVKATFVVTSEQRLKILVGGDGEHGSGFNGGGGGEYSTGGGSSDVRTGNGGLNDRIMVAAGGGASGYSFEGSTTSYRHYWCYGGAGGAGGARIGAPGGAGECNGAPQGGEGAKQHSGGAGGAGGRGYESRGGSHCDGTKGQRGQFLDGGAGGSGCAGPAGGGGGGYYGGGGGGSGGCCSSDGGGGSGGGGGGGSSYVDQSATHVSRIAGGAPRGNGVITITW